MRASRVTVDATTNAPSRSHASPRRRYARGRQPYCRTADHGCPAGRQSACRARLLIARAPPPARDSREEEGRAVIAARALRRAFGQARRLVAWRRAGPAPGPSPALQGPRESRPRTGLTTKAGRCRARRRFTSFGRSRSATPGARRRVSKKTATPAEAARYFRRRVHDDA
jgi:hypothetical protein